MRTILANLKNRAGWILAKLAFFSMGTAMLLSRPYAMAYLICVTISMTWLTYRIVVQNNPPKLFLLAGAIAARFIER